MTTSSLHTNNASAGTAFFAELAADIGDLLDLHPEGITQERVWLHRKKLGRTASVDQIRVKLDRLTQDGELVSAKNGKNETVWKRAARGGVVTAKPTTLIGEKPSEQTVSAERPLPPELLPVLQQMEDVRALHRIEALTRPAITAALVATHVLPEPLEAAMTPPVDPPKPDANAKPIVHKPRKSNAGAAIEAAIVDKLLTGPATRQQLMEFTGASGTGVDNALKRLADRVARNPAKLWELKGTASGGAATQQHAAPPRAKRSPAKDAAGQGDLESCLARFTQRLQPVSELGEKVAVLDQLSTVLPQPIAERLVQIRQDLVRVGS